MIAVLYVDERGPYMTMRGVDTWGITRDARAYAGPHPIVAHPPCSSWSTMRHLTKRRGDRDCGPRAVAQVRRWGGVLEQPRGSRLWSHCGLPRPGDPPDRFGGVTIEVSQVDWGHVARKRTLLYCVRVRMPTRFPAAREPTHWCSGSRTAVRGAVPPGIKVCSANQRNRTPIAFARWLVRLAETAS